MYWARNNGPLRARGGLIARAGVVFAWDVPGGGTVESFLWGLMHSSKPTWKFRGAALKNTLFEIVPSVGFHFAFYGLPCWLAGGYQDNAS